MHMYALAHSYDVQQFYSVHVPWMVGDSSALEFSTGIDGFTACVFGS